MSEEQMNDTTFGRLFIIMIITMTVLTAIIMVLASFMAGDVNDRLDQRRDIENSHAIAERIAPVGELANGSTAPAPIAQATEPVVLSGEEAYSNCAACHASGIAGAPATGDLEAWSNRLAQGIDTLYDHAINGFTGNTGVMPAKGGTSLSDDSIKTAVDYMVAKSK